MSLTGRRVAVVGGGWAGLACAIEATRAGHSVALFEAARSLGGRARSVAVRMPDGSSAMLDNGQHILIGAYGATLGLMRSVGVDVDAVLLRMPLTLRFPDGGGLAVPRWPPPFDLLAGIATASGWSWRDKAALITAAVRWRLARFRCARGLTVAALCGSLTPRVMAELIEPLCLSALNTPVDRASAQVFLRVLHDALFAERGGADLLLPRVDLAGLFPDYAYRWLTEHGADVRIGKRVQSIEPGSAEGSWRVDGETFDRAVLACSPWEAERLAADIDRDEPAAWSGLAGRLRHESIATVYIACGSTLQSPVVALRFGPGLPAQFVLDRSQLGGPAGLLAFVVSSSIADRETLENQVLRQARDQLGLMDCRAVQTIVERRATFACTTDLLRPGSRIAPGLLACGDYVDGPYPATLEGAVRSGIAAVAGLD